MSVLQGEAERVGTVQPGEKKTQEDLTNMYKCLMGGNKEDGARLFAVLFSLFFL